jgi:hypothetical protein
MNWLQLVDLSLNHPSRLDRARRNACVHERVSTWRGSHRHLSRCRGRALIQLLPRVPDVLGAWVQRNRLTSYSQMGIRSQTFL